MGFFIASLSSDIFNRSTLIHPLQYSGYNLHCQKKGITHSNKCNYGFRILYWILQKGKRDVQDITAYIPVTSSLYINMLSEFHCRYKRKDVLSTDFWDIRWKSRFCCKVYVNKIADALIMYIYSFIRSLNWCNERTAPIKKKCDREFNQLMFYLSRSQFIAFL